MVRDMTKGSPVRLLLTFAAPLLVANIFQQLYTVVDAVVLGRGVGVRALAAAGSTGSVHFLVFGFITGLTHGYSILISQKFGAGSAACVRRAVANSAYIAVLSSAVITVLSLVFSRGLMELMQTPADIFEDALLYIRIIFIGIFATVFYNVLASILRARGDSVSPLVVILISSAVNVGLDVLFVMVFRWGVAGAAWATVLAQLLSGLMCLFVLSRMELMRFEQGDARPDGAMLRELLRLGVPVGVMNSVTAVGAMLWVLGLLFVYRFSLQSMGDTVVPMLSGALELLLRISIVLLLANVFRLGFLSVCIAEVSAWLGAAVLLCATYYCRAAKAAQGAVLKR